MKKQVLASAVAVAIGVLVAGSAARAEDVKTADTNKTFTAKEQTACPIMEGNPINKEIFTDYNGKRVYFCCKGCPPVFAKEPEKYIKKMTDAGIVLEDTPKKDGDKTKKPAVPEKKATQEDKKK